jgi:hypothetical protein
LTEAQRAEILTRLAAERAERRKRVLGESESAAHDVIHGQHPMVDTIKQVRDDRIY